MHLLYFSIGIFPCLACCCALFIHCSIACGSRDRLPMRSWQNKEWDLDGFEFLMDLYEIENSMVGNHLGFDFNLVKGLASQSGYAHRSSKGVSLPTTCLGFL